LGSENEEGMPPTHCIKAICYDGLSKYNEALTELLLHLKKYQNSPIAWRMFCKVLNDLDYANNLLELQGKNIENFQDILDAELLDVKNLFKQIITDYEKFSFLWYEYDFDNLKLALREKEGKQVLEHQYSKLGNYEPAKIRKFVSEQYFPVLDDSLSNLSDVLKKADQKLSENGDSNLFNAKLDNYYLEIFKDSIISLNSDYLEEFVNFRIDFHNIKNLLRLHQLNKHSLIPDYIAVEGNLKIKDLIKALSQDDLMLIIFNQDYYEYIKLGIDKLYDKGSFTLFEKNTGDFQVNYFKSARYENYGPEMIAAFWYAKRNEVRNIRKIILEKIYSIDSEKTRGYLRKNF